MEKDGVHARVFISCGQSKESDEVNIAEKIADRLKQCGFDPYVAVAEQCLWGVRENIFEQLRKSEYFVFVDFKREKLADTRPEMHRGSLFSHQELAIASFLDIEVLAFQETGVRTDDGLIKFLQANAVPFTDRHLLPNVVADKVQEHRWRKDWRNELVLERERQEFPDAKIDNSTEIGRFFHINVHNHHREKLATNCCVYLEKAIRRPDTNIPLKTIEFKWAGAVLPFVGIAPGAMRAFDAFFILHSCPTQLWFNVFTDSSQYRPQFPEGIGQYELSYVVRADNFPPARGCFILDLKNVLDETVFVPT